MYRGKKIGVVVPAYNEEPHIAAVLEGMPDFVDRVYVVDDASTDRTADIVRSFCGNGSAPHGDSRPHAGAGLSACPSGSVQTVATSGDGTPHGDSGPDEGVVALGWQSRVHLIQHECNRGVGGAIVTGYRRCLADDIDIAAVMAGDNQMEPAWLPAVLESVVEGLAEYSKGTRLTDAAHVNGMSPWRRLGNFTLRWLTVIASGNRGVTDPQNGYAAISREALGRLDLDRVYPYYGYCNDLVVRLSVRGERIAEIPMPSMYHGEVSKIRYSRYIPKVSCLLLRLFVRRITGCLGQSGTEA